jgi:HPr kinase/phosphorylase
MPAATIEDLFRGAEQRLGLCAVSGTAGLKRRTDRVRVQSLQNADSPELLSGMVLIIPGHVQSRWTQHPDERKSALQKISSLRIPAVFLSGSHRIPDYFGPWNECSGVPVIASMHDEFLLESRLMGLLREKIDRICFRHGVLLNICGRGVLLAGDSGIGKTTLGIRLARRGCMWVADDIIEIERKGNRLHARGHRRSRHLMHMRTLGITETRRIIRHGNRLDETILDLVVESVRPENARPGRSLREKETCDILSIKVPRLEHTLDRGKYMEISRFEQAVHSFFKRSRE